VEDIDKINDAIRAARMYYYQNMATEAIAHELNTSRSTISRLLSFARQNGLVDIRIIDPMSIPSNLSRKLGMAHNQFDTLLISCSCRK